jgi:hypothetical protein
MIISCELTGQHLYNFELAFFNSFRNQFSNERLNFLRSLRNSGTCELGLHQHALLAMTRVILRNHVAFIH